MGEWFVLSRLQLLLKVDQGLMGVNNYYLEVYSIVASSGWSTND